MIFSEKFISSIAITAWIICAHWTGFAVSVNCDIEPKNNDGKLRKSLFCKYDRTVHPALNGDAVTVTLKMIVKGFSFDEHEKVLLVSSWLSKSWQDDNLKWTPAEFNGINHLVESSEELWQPDLQLFNSDIASVHDDQCRISNCDISSTGHVACIPPCVHSARCAPDLTAWPFDSVNCTLHIGTWINSADEVDLKLKQLIIPESDLQSQDQSWKMVKVLYTRNHGNFSSTSKTYPSVTFTFLLERHSAEHAATFLVPALSKKLYQGSSLAIAYRIDKEMRAALALCIVFKLSIQCVLLRYCSMYNYVMASINLITSWLSPEMSERLMLLALNILSHFLYMQQLSWYIPFNGDICPTIAVLPNESLNQVWSILLSILMGVLCFRDSLIITGFLLINTIVVRGFTSCGLEVPNWIGSTTGFVGSNKFGELFLSKSYLIDRQPLHSEQCEETADVNVTEPQTLPTVTIKPPTNTWKLFAKYIDRLLFIIVFVLYVCMYFALVPSGYKFAEPRGDIEVLGV